MPISLFIKPSIKHFTLLLLFLVMAVSISSCNKTEPLKIAYHPWIGYQIPFLNETTSSDSSVLYRKTNNSAESMQLLKTKKVDAAYLTLDEVLSMQDQGIDLTIVLIADISAGADIVLGQSNIKTVQDIKNKTIGYEANALGEFMLYHFLKKYKLTKNDVNLINIDVNHSPTAFKNKQIDIAITYYPIAQKLFNLNAVKLFDSREIPDTIIDVLAVRTSIAKQNDYAILSALKNHLLGVNYLQANYGDSKYQLAALLETSTQEVDNSLSRIILPKAQANIRLLNNQEGISKIILELSKQMQAANLIHDLNHIKPTINSKYIKSIKLLK